jgi:TetR/AcrR family acrAB operon transcriptional repressor
MRRTREESEKTRESILRAARNEFAQRGVSQTTMEHIAAAAGVSRGAVYGHFRNKSELFFAMRDKVALPMVDRIGGELLNAPGDPLAAVERYLLGVMGALKSDRTTRETYFILGFKCEYVGDFARDMKRQTTRCGEISAQLEIAFRKAARAGQLRAGLGSETAALQTCAFLVGLVRLWLLDSGKKLVRGKVAALIAAHMHGIRRMQ